VEKYGINPSKAKPYSLGSKNGGGSAAVIL
jgi:hypothetical protein